MAAGAILAPSMIPPRFYGFARRCVDFPERALERRPTFALPVDGF
jgi:hypothetical protein